MDRTDFTESPSLRVVSYAVPGTARIRRLGEDLLANATNSSTAGLRRKSTQIETRYGRTPPSQKRTVLRPCLAGIERDRLTWILLTRLSQILPVSDMALHGEKRDVAYHQRS